jgi:hypothetical protein
MYVLPVVVLRTMPVVFNLGQYLQLFVVQIFVGLMVVLLEELVVGSGWGWVLILDLTKVLCRFFGLLLPTTMVLFWMKSSRWSISRILRLSFKIFLMGGFWWL